jgi:N-carbamoyl-L-amino-acid hydrolase
MEIDAQRLWQTILTTGRIGATERGGVCRLTLSDEDRCVRDWFVAACRRESCRVTIDDMGNVFARRRGRRADLPPIAIGSHLDTQPTGGRFDGILGVLAGLEVVRTLNENGIETEHPIEIIDWTNEEGARFAPAMLGSGVFTGILDKRFAHGCEDRDGTRFGDELARIGYRGEEPCGRHPLDSYFELHIEQGPVLEAEKKTIGIVEGAQGIRWYDLELEGEAAHAGTTPMDMRRDASLAAAQTIGALPALAKEFGPGAFATAGVIEAHPNSRNVVPSRIFLTVDLRHTQEEVLERMERRLETLVEESCAHHRVDGKLNRIWDSAPIRFHPDCVAAVREAAEASCHPCRAIVSGAGHDAVYISRVVPSAMIFIPCKGGISHNESESAELDHVAAGASVLLAAAMARDRAVASRPQSAP